MALAPAPAVPQPPTRMARGMVTGAAWSLLALPFAMITAWNAGGDTLDKIVPGFFQMKPNASLAMGIAGLGLLSALRQSRRYTFIAATLLMIVGGVTLAEYATGVRPGIDLLFVQDLHSPDTRYPGRMAVGSAVAFIAAATYLLIIAGGDLARPWRIAILELLGFLVFALGAEGLIWHLQTLTFGPRWGLYVRMSPQGGAGLVMLGLGLMCLAWDRRDRGAERMPLWLPGLLCFIVFMGDIATPLPLAAGVAYIPILFCSLWFRQPYMAFVLAAITSVLTLIGYYLSPPDDSVIWIAAANRTLTIGGLWFVALLVHMLRVTLSNRFGR